VRDKPAWKYYYESRNQVYHRLHVTRPGPERPVPRHLTVRVRARRAGRSVTRLAAGAVWHERHGRLRKLLMVGRGMVDGLLGRLGRTVVPDRPDRPMIGKPGA
jgi:hypothetical protein